MKKSIEPKISAIIEDLVVRTHDTAQNESNRESTEKTQTLNAIRKGLIDVKNGKTKPSDQFFQEFFERFEIESQE